MLNATRKPETAVTLMNVLLTMAIVQDGYSASIILDTTLVNVQMVSRQKNILMTYVCHDKDECSQVGLSACNGTGDCINTIGGYECADMAVSSPADPSKPVQWLAMKLTPNDSYMSCSISNQPSMKLSVWDVKEQHAMVYYRIERLYCRAV